MSNRSIKNLIIVPELVRVIIIDSLCGAGGFTEGAEKAADEFGRRLAIVAAGLNHDKLALESHARNHPETVHFREDMRDKTLPYRILAVIEQAKKLYPNAIVLFHCSLECTNFSNAKGGKTRDADSRSLAIYMPNYLEILKPDLFTVENVREFKAWGPLVPKVEKTKEGYSYCPITFDIVTEELLRKSEPENFEVDNEFIQLFNEYMARHEVFSLKNLLAGKCIGDTIALPLLIPESRTKGKYFLFWRQYIENTFGFVYDDRLHNTADFGANTSRTRYFAQFAQAGIPIAWPSATHAKNPGNSLFGSPLKKWKPIRECLELEDKGKSIFRDKPLSDKTYERIFEGLVRHVGNGDRAFLSKYFTGKGMDFSLNDPAHTITNVDHHALISTQPFMARLFATASNGHGTYKSDQPATTITTADGHAVVTPEPFAMSYYSGSPANRVKSMDDPALTLTTENRLALVSSEAFCMKYHTLGGHNTFSTGDPCSTLPTRDSVGVVSAEQFVSLYYSSGKQDQSIESPGSALTTIPKHRLVSAQFVDQQYGQSKPSSLDDPAACITVNPHSALVQAFIADPQWFGHSHSIDQPGHTVIARQDKAPSSLVSPQYVMNTNFNNVGADLSDPSHTITADRHWAYLITAEQGVYPVILVYATDSLIIRKIKAFMAEYGIVDILMRMLKVQELKRIQGFPENYVLLGSQTDQKKFIGNSIPPPYVKAWMEAVGFAVRALKGGVAA